jgi:hypothetical protein
MIESGVASAIDLAHAAFADLGNNRVLSDRCVGEMGSLIVDASKRGVVPASVLSKQTHCGGSNFFSSF